MMKEKQLDLQFDSPLEIGHSLLDIGHSSPPRSCFLEIGYSLLDIGHSSPSLPFSTL